MAFSGKKRNIRQRRKSSDSEDEDHSTLDVSTILEETKEAQKFRERPRGVSATVLLTGKKQTKVEELGDDDPFKLRSGGMITLKDIKDRNRDRSDEAYDRDVANMGSTFAVETNQRDEDAEMMKYIEVEMKKKKGLDAIEEGKEASKESTKHKTPEDKLYELPDYLKVEAQKRSEEMLSNQMLSGIPEVDLGIDAKIRNIEATEEAKQKHIEERRNKKKNTTSFVPANMAVNYVQHSRYMHEDYYANKHHHRHHHREEAPKPKPVVVGDADQPRKPEPSAPTHKRKVPNAEKATDDYHYERFKKQLRRY
ncbi:splicing factor C9orf78-like [Diadema antillarum]|uniref:splicing factor C9orf78-like n=1 Tax=Diadema antillarum TaxID=105358 RepID=UPI003A89FE47